MSRAFQKILLVVGIMALVVLVIEMYLAVSATMHGSKPEKVVHTSAGPYALAVSLYDDPARAGFALPFVITSQQHVALSYEVSSIPGQGVHATPIRAALSTDTNAAGGIQGTAEITVQGTWYLHIVVHGSAGEGTTDVPITAQAPPAIPIWLGWMVGLLPLFGLLLFLLAQLRRKETPAILTSEPV